MVVEFKQEAWKTLSKDTFHLLEAMQDKMESCGITDLLFNKYQKQLAQAKYISTLLDFTEYLKKQQYTNDIKPSDILGNMFDDWFANKLIELHRIFYVRPECTMDLKEEVTELDDYGVLLSCVIDHLNNYRIIELLSKTIAPGDYELMSELTTQSVQKFILAAYNKKHNTKHKHYSELENNNIVIDLSIHEVDLFAKEYCPKEYDRLFDIIEIENLRQR